MKKRIAIFTSNRSEWGLLRPLAFTLQNKYDLKIIACASHFSSTYETFIDIIPDFDCERIENTLDSNTPEGCCKSSGILMINLPDKLRDLNPDAIIILGDRYESLCAAFVAYTMNIKIIHFHGGERSGNLDDAYRDCISRMSYIHFTATSKSHYNLVSSLICDRRKVICIGALGCIDLPKYHQVCAPNILIVYHPVTNSEEDFREVIYALESISDNYIINFILANNDFGGKIINSTINNFISSNKYTNFAFSHLNRKVYLKLMSESLCIIGNSSSGIIEAPQIGVPTINIGERQKNRETASSIKNVRCDRSSILEAFEQLKENNFKSDFSYIPYKPANINKIVEIIEEYI